MILAAMPLWFQTIIDSPEAVITWIATYGGSLGISVSSALTAIIKVKNSATSTFKKFKTMVDEVIEKFKTEMEEKMDNKIKEKTSSIDKLIIILASARIASNAVSTEEKESLIDAIKELTGEVLVIPEKIQTVLEDINEINIQTVLNGETIEEASNEKTN